MTLESTVVKTSYDGDDATVAFPTGFIFWDDTDIEAILLDADGVETTWVDGTQFTMSGGDGLAGTLTVETTPTDYTPATGETLVIRSNREDRQSSALPLGGPFPSTLTEQALDQLVRLIQQRSEELERTLKVAKTSTLTDLELPNPVTGQTLIGNAAADGYDNAEPSAGSAILNDNNLGTSQTQATSQNSVLEFFKNGVVTMINKVLKGCHLQADDGTEVLDPGTDGTDATFAGTVSALAGACAPTTMTSSAWPSFSAYLNASQTNITGSDKIDFDTESFDTNNDFAGGAFTPTVAGKYLLSVGLVWSSNVSGDIFNVIIKRNGASVRAFTGFLSGANASFGFTDIVDANGTTDYFEVFVENVTRDTSAIVGGITKTCFSGSRIG